MLLRKLAMVVAGLGFLGFAATASAQEDGCVWNVQVKLNPSLTVFDFFKKFAKYGVPPLAIADVSERDGVGIINLNIASTTKTGAEKYLSLIQDKNSFLTTTVMDIEGEVARSASDVDRSIQTATYYTVRLPATLTALHFFSALSAGEDFRPSIRLDRIATKTDPIWLVMSFSNPDLAADVAKQLRTTLGCMAIPLTNEDQLTDEILSRMIAHRAFPDKPVVQADSTNRCR